MGKNKDRGKEEDKFSQEAGEDMAVIERELTNMKKNMYQKELRKQRILAIGNKLADRNDAALRKLSKN